MLTCKLHAADILRMGQKYNFGHERGRKRRLCRCLPDVLSPRLGCTHGRGGSPSPRTLRSLDAALSVSELITDRRDERTVSRSCSQVWRTFWISASLNFPQTFLLMDMSVRKDIAEPEDESQARLSDILALTRIRWMEGALGRPGRQRHFVGVHHR